MHDPATGRRRAVHALILTAAYSRHISVHLSFTQTLDAVVARCERAREFFGGVFAVWSPEYVPRKIFGVLCPPRLCALVEPMAVTAARWRWWRHINDQSEAS